MVLASVPSRGFTRVEILIVVSILTAMAALVGPQLTSAASSRRETVLADQLRYLRTQVLIYRAQHMGVPPGYPDGSLAAEPTRQAFIDQMRMYTSVDGRTSTTFDEEFHCGPYLQEVPANPVNGSSTIQFIRSDKLFPVRPAGDDGWLYKPTTCTVAANVEGRDINGVAFIDY